MVSGMRGETPKVVIFDDDLSICKSLKRLLRLEGIDSLFFTRFSEFEQHCAPGAIDCLILDLNMPEVEGREVQKMVRKIDPATAIVFLTAFGSVPVSVEAMKNGAVDFLRKPVEEDALLAAVSQALSVSRSNREILENQHRTRTKLQRLTPREEAVLERVLTGLMNKEIAEELKISIKTVKIHRANMMRKMQASTLLELAEMIHPGLDRKKIRHLCSQQSA